jgi:dTMP kinase
LRVTTGTRGQGRFITLEGPDGAGKSEQADRLAASMRAAGRTVVQTREPGGTALGEHVRVLLLDPSLDRSPEAEALLFSAARAELVSEVIRPALARGDTVICDRFADSSLAYQGHGAGTDLGWLRALQLLATGGLVPDLTILIDVPVALGLARRAGGAAGELTRFEADDIHDIAYHERVRAGFLALAVDEPDRWRIVDGTADRDEVGRRVRLAAVELLGTAAGPDDRPTGNAFVPAPTDAGDGASEPSVPLLRTKR